MQEGYGDSLIALIDVGYWDRALLAVTICLHTSHNYACHFIITPVAVLSKYQPPILYSACNFIHSAVEPYVSQMFQYNCVYMCNPNTCQSQCNAFIFTCIFTYKKFDESPNKGRGHIASHLISVHCYPFRWWGNLIGRKMEWSIFLTSSLTSHFSWRCTLAS